MVEVLVLAHPYLPCPKPLVQLVRHGLQSALSKQADPLWWFFMSLRLHRISASVDASITSSGCYCREQFSASKVVLNAYGDLGLVVRQTASGRNHSNTTVTNTTSATLYTLTLPQGIQVQFRTEISNVAKFRLHTKHSCHSSPSGQLRLLIDLIMCLEDKCFSYKAALSTSVLLLSL